MTCDWHDFLVKVLSEQSRFVGSIENHLNLKNDLKLDSLDAVEFIVQVEQRLGFSLNENEILKSETVGDLIEKIQHQLKDKPSLPTENANVHTPRDDGN